MGMTGAESCPCTYGPVAGAVAIAQLSYGVGHTGSRSQDLLHSIVSVRSCYVR